MNHKNARIKKLLLKGMSPERIARKTGLPLERVTSGLAWIRKFEFDPNGNPLKETSHDVHE
jgi:hypothetical protein